MFHVRKQSIYSDDTYYIVVHISNDTLGHRIRWIANNVVRGKRGTCGFHRNRERSRTTTLSARNAHGSHHSQWPQGRQVNTAHHPEHDVPSRKGSNVYPGNMHIARSEVGLRPPSGTPWFTLTPIQSSAVPHPLWYIKPQYHTHVPQYHTHWCYIFVLKT